MSASNRRRASSAKGAPAAALLAKPAPTKIIESEAVVSPDAPSPAPGPAVPLATADLDEHKRLQAAHREHRAMLEREAASARAEAPPESRFAPQPAEQPTPAMTREERVQRAAQEALGAYLTALIEMKPDEPRYVVGRRGTVRSHGLQLVPGDVVPGAHGWTRLDSWLVTGRIMPAPVLVGSA